MRGGGRSSLFFLNCSYLICSATTSKKSSPVRTRPPPPPPPPLRGRPLNYSNSRSGPGSALTCGREASLKGREIIAFHARRSRARLQGHMQAASSPSPPYPNLAFFLPPLRGCLSNGLGIEPGDRPPRSLAPPPSPPHTPHKLSLITKRSPQPTEVKFTTFARCLRHLGHLKMRGEF